MMRLVDYIKFRLDEAISMCNDNTSTKTDIALYLRNFEKNLYGGDKTIIDGTIKDLSDKAIETTKSNNRKDDDGRPLVPSIRNTKA